MTFREFSERATAVIGKDAVAGMRDGRYVVLAQLGSGLGVVGQGGSPEEALGSVCPCGGPYGPHGSDACPRQRRDP